jgi:hypothetical protein
LGLAGISVLLLTPSLIWIFKDVTVWPWDQSNYAVRTLGDVQSMEYGFLSWYQHLMAPIVTPPLLVWTGQLFAPLSALIGRYEPALLLTNILFGFLTLIFVGSAARRLTNSIAAAVTAILICAGSSIFLAMTNNYFAESPQIMAVALLTRVTIEAGYEPWRVFLAKFLFASIIAMGAKFSAFIIIIPFALYALCVLFIRRKALPQASSSRRIIVAGILCIPISAAIIIWYILNISFVLGHARRFSSSELALNYGTESSFFTKLDLWWNNLSAAVTPFSYLGWTLLALCLCALAYEAAVKVRFIARNGRSFSTASLHVVSSGYLFALCLAGTIAFLLAIYSSQINEDMRFVAPIIPIVSVLIAWSISAFRSTIVATAAIAVFALNYGATQATNLGFHRVGSPTPYLQPFKRNTASVERIRQAVDETCTSVHPLTPIVIAVSIADFNINSINFEAAKQQGPRGFECVYGSYQPYETDTANAIGMIKKLGSDVVLTLPIKDLPGPDHGMFFANRPAIDLAKWLAASGEFKLTSSPDAPIEVYRRISP